MGVALNAACNVAQDSIVFQGRVALPSVVRCSHHCKLAIKPMNRFARETILEILREAEFGTPLRELRRKHGFSEASYYYWRAKYGRGAQDGGRTIGELEAENRRLKILLAEAVYQLDSTTPRAAARV
jgi:putative transposase